MYRRISAIVAALNLLPACVLAQSILFDFEDVALHSPLPLTLTSGGVTARFSATGAGFSIQPANSLGFTPAGFAGDCLYPDSIFASDLEVSFTPTITNFSILYASAEVAGDSSARVRVTAYLADTTVGTATTNANPPGTWPSATLAFRSSQSFDRVVVHYDAPPPTGGDYSPIFMADDVRVTPAAPLAFLLQGSRSPGGAFQLSFTNRPGLAPQVRGASNPAIPLAQWTVLGSATEISPGQYQFTGPSASDSPALFYRVIFP